MKSWRKGEKSVIVTLELGLGSLKQFDGPEDEKDLLLLVCVPNDLMREDS